MGMVLCLKTASDEDIALMLATPSLAFRFLMDGATEEERQEMFEGQSPERQAPEPISLWGRVARWLGLGARGGAREKLPPPPRPGFGAGEEEADLDKAWHAIHWLLTGDAKGGEMPQASLLRGGREIGKIEFGYGPARALTSSETSAFQVAIARISTDELRSRYDGKKMDEADVYPNVWERDGLQDGFDDYIEYFFDALKALLAKAVAAKKGLIIWV